MPIIGTTAVSDVVVFRPGNISCNTYPTRRGAPFVSARLLFRFLCGGPAFGPVSSVSACAASGCL
eukprot:2347338-Lingulodinium_polyedra.AAC.1